MTTVTPPFKSVAVALLFTALLGPLGLLYASLWGGIFMLTLGVIVLSGKLLTFPILLVWIISCIWSVRAVESYNHQLIQKMQH